MIRSYKLILTLLFLTSCSVNQAEIIIREEYSEINLSDPWVVSEPSLSGVENLKSISEKASKMERLTSLAIIRDGKIVFEEYFRDQSKTSLHDVRSVTKSIISLLTHIAIKEGFITSLEDPIWKYLKDTGFELSEEQKEIKIIHLLTMSSGFEWLENSGNDFVDWVRSDQHIEFLLNRELINEPGSEFTYNSAAVHLLGVIIQEGSGIGLDNFAEEYFFSKIGVEQAYWETMSNGYKNGGAGIRSRTRDLARIGQLMLQDGRSGEDQIIEENWVYESTAPYYDWRADYGDLQNYTYGYLWWVKEIDDTQKAGYLAWGYGGQFIYVVPAKNLVIVTTNDWRNASSVGGSSVLELETFNLIFNHILPKVRD
ncbi:MAG: serine hydrolase [Balneolaceae bacterium]|nr:serine hydrolase [Balneolaceae bacterium]MBO6545342.1 serine hydrolase [Balneolaceae bacterium]MBO6646738.1 serine hydrolase [Balneolaceae bacterium]